MRKDRGLELDRVQELFLHKKIEADYHSSSSYVFWVAPFTFDMQRT
jgi:hypothetical protein